MFLWIVPGVSVIFGVFSSPRAALENFRLLLREDLGVLAGVSVPAFDSDFRLDEAEAREDCGESGWDALEGTNDFRLDEVGVRDADCIGESPLRGSSASNGSRVGNSALLARLDLEVLPGVTDFDILEALLDCLFEDGVLSCPGDSAFMSFLVGRLSDVGVFAIASSP